MEDYSGEGRETECRKRWSTLLQQQDKENIFGVQARLTCVFSVILCSSNYHRFIVRNK